MSMRKIFRRTVPTLFFAVILFVNAVSHAEIYTAEGSYVMSEVENLKVARERAKANAMRYACEKAGVYVESRTEVRNAQVTKDEIITMTSSILKIIDVQYHREHADNNTTLIRATVKAQIDDSDIIKWLNKDSREKAELVAQMEALRKANAEQERQIAELKRQLTLATTAQDKEQITQEFVTEDNKFLSNQKVADGWKLWDKKDFNGAAKLFDEAVQLNPNDAQAYTIRGASYAKIGNFKQAFVDATKSIKIHPNDATAYQLRGICYQELGENEKAQSDFAKAKELGYKD